MAVPMVLEEDEVEMRVTTARAKPTC
jgi:hypothetical protein